MDVGLSAPLFNVLELIHVEFGTCLWTVQVYRPDWSMVKGSLRPQWCRFKDPLIRQPLHTPLIQIDGPFAADLMVRDSREVGGQEQTEEWRTGELWVKEMSSSWGQTRWDDGENSVSVTALQVVAVISAFRPRLVRRFRPDVCLIEGDSRPSGGHVIWGTPLPLAPFMQDVWPKSAKCERETPQRRKQGERTLDTRGCQGKLARQLVTAK